MTHRPTDIPEKYYDGSWDIQEESEGRISTGWKMTHKETGKVERFTTYGDGWGYSDSEMMGMDSGTYSEWLAEP